MMDKNQKKISSLKDLDQLVGKKNGKRNGQEKGQSKNKKMPRKANIGWLFCKDYYRDIEELSEKNSERYFEEKNQGIRGKKLAGYKPEIELLKMDFDNIESFELTTIYPGLLTGSGTPHETRQKGEYKLGFYFDHTTGLPIIPGSTVKGVIRSAFKRSHQYIQSLLKEIPDIQQLEKEIFDGIFKKENGEDIDLTIYQRDIFFDAVVSKTHNPWDFFLGEDFITPHAHPFKDPVPIPFLKVLPQVTFCFRFRFNPGGMIAPASKRELCKQILLDLGIGAKTNVGYGKFMKKGGG